MSFFQEPVSGEALPFDPFIFIPFGGSLRSGAKEVSTVIRGPLEGLVGKAAQTTQKAITQFEREAALPGKGIFDDIGNFFARFLSKPSGTVGLAAARAGQRQITTISRPTISTSTKAVVGAGIIGGSTIGTVGILSLTPGGQQLTEAAKDTVQSVTKFLTENPLIPIGILLVVGLALVGGAKK